MSYQNQYNHLRKAGLSHAGALGSMGNFEAESGCESVRLQGDYDMRNTIAHFGFRSAYFDV